MLYEVITRHGAGSAPCSTDENCIISDNNSHIQPLFARPAASAPNRRACNPSRLPPQPQKRAVTLTALFRIRHYHECLVLAGLAEHHVRVALHGQVQVDHGGRDVGEVVTAIQRQVLRALALESYNFV